MVNYVFPILLVLAVGVNASTLADTRRLGVEVHTNHYIVLIDASASTVTTAGKKASYQKALTEDLLDHLFRSGFGDSIPAYDQARDRLTILHFGIVPDRTGTLSNYDFQTDFIHRTLVRKERADLQSTRAKLVASQNYQYTILSWAKQLALLSSRPSKPDELANRTFLIVVSDGLPNENSIRGELEMVRRWGGKNYETISPIVDAIDRDYRFTDGRHGERPAWTMKSGEGAGSGFAPIFIEAYQVLSKAQIDWEEKANHLQPLNKIRFNWTETQGDNPQGELAVELTPEFISWAEEAGSYETSLSIGPDGEIGRGPGLVVRAACTGPLTCQPRILDAVFNVTAPRTDPLLGRVVMNYSYSQRVITPLPVRCTALFAGAIALSGLVAIGALCLLGYFLNYRLRKTHLRLEIPGTLAGINIPRKGQHAGVAPLLPQVGLEAFSINLPGKLVQWLFLRGTTISLKSNEATGVTKPFWLGHSNLDTIQLPLSKGYMPAFWVDLPKAPSTITVEFRQGTQHSEVCLDYAKSFPNELMRSNLMSESEIEAWVALDLGSESMAAYYETLDSKTGMIDLQHFGPTLRPGGTLERLMEGIGNREISPRLWNRISLRDGAQPKQVEEDHALLRFVQDPDVYRRSLFNFFHLVGGWPPGGKAMPNPKILFQQQVQEILTRLQVVAKDGTGEGKSELEYVSLSPEMLIHHLTVQVINNFILCSKELKEIDNKKIHLTITVPNVYSLPHSESIKLFIKSKLPGLGAVEVLSESDAVAYYALKTVDERRDSAELVEFKAAWSREFAISKQLCLVTIDVGKGTTDLSCVLVQQPRTPSTGLSKLFNKTSSADGQPEDKRRRHSVQGKTGKSSGGNYLNYVFAKFYDSQIKDVARQILLTDSLAEREFSLLKLAPNRVIQAEALSELERLIEQVKASMSENYEIDENLFPAAEERSRIERIVDYVVQMMPSAAQQGDLQAFRRNVIEALLLPNRLVPESQSSRLATRISDFVRRLRKGSSSTDPPAAATGVVGEQRRDPTDTSRTGELKRLIEVYVDENVSELMTSLRSLVREHQTFSEDKQGIDSNSFVVVSGQASQFKPLRKAIIKACGELGISKDQMLTDLGPVALKEACCRGAVSFWRGMMYATNPNELSGTYGCLDYFGKDYRAFDMKRINTKGTDTIAFPATSTHLVVFTPRSHTEVQERPPKLNDGSTALIAVIAGQNSFTLTYDRASLSLKISNKELTIGNFGNVDSSVFEKVWPEILEP